MTHRDAGRRGLAAYRRDGAPLDRGQLRAAALDLAEHARDVAIVTGFPVIVGDRVRAETDGPPGALFLAQALESLAVDVTLVTDCHALGLLACGRDLMNLERTRLVEFPFGDDATTDRWVEEFLSRGRGKDVTHLIAIERPGPSHTLDTLRSQTRDSGAAVARFEAEVFADDRGRCHDMRGTVISDRVAGTHQLFDFVRQRKRSITTIGIGDGGNEIGMGRFPWEEVTAAIGGGAAGRIVSHVATDYCVIAGVSNWGAYALALAMVCLRGGDVSSRWISPEGQRELIETLVGRAGAVDGRTLASEPTVDGLSPDAHLRPLAEMRRIIDPARSSSP